MIQAARGLIDLHEIARPEDLLVDRRGVFVEHGTPGPNGDFEFLAAMRFLREQNFAVIAIHALLEFTVQVDEALRHGSPGWVPQRETQADSLASPYLRDRYGGAEPVPHVLTTPQIARMDRLPALGLVKRTDLRVARPNLQVR